jgi:quercetin dioxygenase-like cupin family protein
MEAKKTGAIVTTTYRSKIGFRPERFNPVIIAETERVRFLEICFEPGQFIPAHKPGVDLALVVLEGEGELLAGERRETIRPGSIAFIPAGEARGIKALTRLILLNCVAPPPTGADHEGVEEKIKQGIWP